MTEDFVINKDLVYSTLDVPKAAMTIHGYDPNRLIDDFKDENGNILTNTARKYDVSSDEIAKWTTIHKKGLYNDKIHCPPTYKNCPVKGVELVTGHCPECHLDTILVGIQHSFYRCTNCGEDIEQKVNGVIKYMVVDKKTKIKLRNLDDTDGQEER